MSGSTSTNDQALQFQQQQAAEADAKEAARQARLTQGQDVINQIFEGQPVMATQTTPFDWSSFQPVNPAAAAWAAQNNQAAPTASGVPEGYTAVQTTRPSTATGVAGAKTTDPYAMIRAATGAAASPAASGGGVTWALKDAAGNLHYQGDPFDVTTQVDTGQKTGGFDDAFYQGYGQKYSDYYTADEADQYNKSIRDTRYNLARAGMGMNDSSVGLDKQGELAKQHELNLADIAARTNTAEGDLQNQVQTEKQSLINQLYSTEDPTLTSDLAQSAASALQLKDPTTTPAAALFDPALTAAGAAANTYFSPYQPYTGASAGASAGPNVASANANTGKASGSY